MVPRYRSFALVILGVVACGAKSIHRSDEDGGRGGAAGVGGTGGTSGTGGTDGVPIDCRTYASRETVSGPAGTITFDCTFEREFLRMRCDDGVVSQAWSETWATIEDAVSENRPIGKYKAVRNQMGVVDGPVACMFRFDMRFDSLGRMTAIVVTPELLEGPCDASSESYDTWDSEGRPTHGRAQSAGAGECLGQELDIAYDDAARTVTTTLEEVANCLSGSYVRTYDTNGILVRYSIGESILADHTILETEEFCVE